MADEQAIEFPIEFPVSYKVLVATSDQNWAENIEAVLSQCKFQVTTTSNGAEAIALVREDKDNFDFVFCDEHVADMGGIRLAQTIGLSTAKPTVYTYSGNKRLRSTAGVGWILPKPLKTEVVKNIIEDVRWSMGNRARHRVMRMIEKFPANDVWASEVHYKFVAAIHALGEKACPKTIMEFMNVDGLSKKDVAYQFKRYSAHAQQLKPTRIVPPFTQ